MEGPCVHLWCVSVHISENVKLYPMLAVGTNLNLDVFVFYAQGDAKEPYGQSVANKGVRCRDLHAESHRAQKASQPYGGAALHRGETLGSSANGFSCPVEPPQAAVVGSNATHTPVLPPPAGKLSSLLPSAISAPVFQPLDWFLSYTSKL